MALDNRFWSKVDIRGLNDCWEYKSTLSKDGYGRHTIQKNLKKKTYRSHRYALMQCNINIKDKLVCHKCDNSSCCNPLHLFVGSALDNMQDKVRKGRQAKGENLSNKFTEKDIIYIRSCNLTAKDLAIKYSTTADYIYDIRNYKTWKHI